MDAAAMTVRLDRSVASVRRRPYPYRTSHRLDELEVLLEDGTRLELLLKDLRRSRLHTSARIAKPAFLHDPLREIEAYHLLAPTGLGAPMCHDSGEDWVLLEKVQGVELWQVGDLNAWVDSARWLTRLHSLFAGHPPSSHHLIRYDEDYFRIWPARARRRHPALASITDNYERVVQLLAREPVTLIHGEFYASNILVVNGRIAAVDWEMAGIGPGVLDLAALASGSGWGNDERATIVASYGDLPAHVLDAASLHLAMQWLGWAPDWTPPPEHAHDWLSQAMLAAERLGI
jgi:aminoglycoside phosphotransferase